MINNFIKNHSDFVALLPDSNAFPYALANKKTEGVYHLSSDRIYLFSDRLTDDNFKSVLLHECFHRALHQDVQLKKQLPLLTERLQFLFDQAKSGRGEVIWRMAYLQAIKEKPGRQLEEFGAYAVSAYETKPKGLSNIIKKWASDATGAVRGALIRQGWMPETLLPSDLSALAKQALNFQQTKDAFIGEDVIFTKLARDLNTTAEQIKSEFLTTKEYYQDSWLKAPNGKPSNLSELQWVLVRTPRFKQWFGDWENGQGSKVLGENGEPLVVLHGTTHDINSFSFDKANIKNDLGKGHYTSNSIHDINANYALEGPDLTNRLTNYAEQIEYQLIEDPESLGFDEVSDDDIGEVSMNIARNALKGGDGFVMPLFMNMRNPAILGGKHETYFDLECSYDEEDDSSDELSGSLYDFVESFRIACKPYEASSSCNINNVADELYEKAFDSRISLSNLVKFLSGHEDFLYIENENGDMISQEVIRLALVDAGFDGFIDNTVNDKFGSRSKHKAMGGMNQDTVHYVAFDGNQLKSAIGNSGEFSIDDEDIRFSYAGIHATTANVERLDLAKTLSDQGHSSTAIRETTGWFKGLDDKWRFEFSDHEFSIKQVLDPVEISAKIRKIAGPGVSAAQYINDNPDHELSKEYLSAKAGIRLNDYIDHPALFDAYPELKNYPVFAYKMDSHEGGRLVDTTFHFNDSISKQREAVIHEVQHAIQAFEDFVLGGNYDVAWRFLQDKHRADAEALPSYTDEKFLAAFIVNAEGAINEHDAAHKAYLALGGEIEARDSENRLKLTDEQRAESNPYASQDTSEVFIRLKNVNTLDSYRKFKKQQDDASQNEGSLLCH